LEATTNEQACRATIPLSIPPNINKNTRTSKWQHNNSKESKKPIATVKASKYHQGNVIRIEEQDSWSLKKNITTDKCSIPHNDNKKKHQ